MAKSVEIPQDIIDSIIAEVGDDIHLLKQCSLVSSSFLFPSRKHLFSRITLRSDQACQGIYQFLVQNPLIQSSVRAITVTSLGSGNTAWMNGTSLPVILRLPFRRLECFSINVPPNHCYLKPWNWTRFSSELKDAFSNMIHTSNLKTLSLEGVTEVPTTFFLCIVHLKTLELHSVSPDDFRNENSSSLTPAALTGVGPTASHVAIERCVWRLMEEHRSEHAYVPRVATKSIFLPFICRLRFLKIQAFLGAATMHDFNILSSLIGSLCMSLNVTSPATLEHLEFNISFSGNYNLGSYTFENLEFYEDLYDVWSYLDSITTHPTGSRLRRLDINIECLFHQYFDEVIDPDANEVLEVVLEGLPLLRAKDILFVEVSSWNDWARHEPGPGYCDVQSGAV